MDNQKKNSEDSIVTRWLRRLPLLRAYPALQDVRRELGEARQKIKALGSDLKRANALAAQRELALRSVGAGELQILAEPAFDHDQLAQIARDRSSITAVRSRFRTSLRMGCSTPPFSTEWPASSRRWTVADGTTPRRRMSGSGH